MTRLLAQLKSSKAPGHDNFPPRFLKDGITIIGEPLTHIINLSLRTAVVPGKMKIAKVVPLFKSGSITSVENYRPMSVLSALSKIFERTVYDQLSNYLEHNNLLTTSQFGFRKRYNTELAVTLFTDHIRQSMDQGKLTGAVFIDLQKAFDTVEHSILLSKLPFYGIKGTELLWIKSHLSNRYQFVQCGTAKSEYRLVKYRVPQGSILGPLLFLIHINDLTKSVKNCNIQIYADDTVISFSHKNVNVIEETLTAEMTSIGKWLDNNRLIINLKKGKTESMLFGTAKRLYSQSDLKVSLKENFINFVSGYKYLGVTLDPSLNMSDHLHKTLKNVLVRVRLLKRMRLSLSSFAAESVYKAIVLSKILYCSTPFLMVSDTMANKFERLQRRAIKIIYNQPKSCKECGLMTIQNQKKFKASMIIFKCLQRTIPNFASYIDKVDHTYYTRGNSSTLRLPKIRTEAASKSFKFQGPSCYNEVPINIRKLNSLVLFKHQLKEHLLSN